MKVSILICSKVYLRRLRDYAPTSEHRADFSARYFLSVSRERRTKKVAKKPKLFICDRLKIKSDRMNVVHSVRLSLYGCIVLRDIQQLKFHSSAKLQRRDYLSLVFAEGDIFPINVPVALVQHLNKSAFRSVAIA